MDSNHASYNNGGNNGGGRNFPRYSAYAGGGGSGSNGGGASGGSNGGGANGARRKQRAGRYANNNGNNGHRNYGGGDGTPRFSPNPQKLKSYTDKRPRTRNNVCGGDLGDSEIAPGTREAFGYSLDAVDSHESFGAQRGRVGKKTNYNVNHLLNFRYEEPKRGRHHHDGLGRAPGRGRKSSTSSTGHIAFNKEHYLLATCQFVVHSSVDPTPYLDNPDLLVDWSVVEQVRIRSVGDELCCPICLEPPVAPQVTKCGHVFCFACLLHHAATAEKKWSTCPICFEMVYVEDLRSATLLPTPAVSVGDVLEMTLMTVVANPVEGSNRLPRPVIPTDDDCDDASAAASTSATLSAFQKILSLSEAEILSSVLELEKSAIETAKKSADDLEAMFLDQALDAVNIRKEKMSRGQWEKNVENDFLQAVTEDDDRDVVNVPLGVKDDDAAFQADWFDVEDAVLVNEAFYEVDEGISCDTAEIQVEESEANPAHHKRGVEEIHEGAEEENLENREEEEEKKEEEKKEEEKKEEASAVVTTKSSSSALSSAGDYFFFQSSDGQKIFLHSVNVKCLAFEYGALNAAPISISGRIVQIDEGIVTEGLRKRCRYLSTLPNHCPFKVIELDLKSPLVSDEALENFAAELESRKQQRQSKERYEKRFHRKQQKKEKRNNAATVIVPSVAAANQQRSRQNSEQTMTADAMENNQPSQQMTTMFPEFNVTVVKPGVNDPPPPADDDQVASFAEMLRSGKTKSQSAVKAWPELASQPNSAVNKSIAGDVNPWGMKKLVAGGVGAVAKDTNNAPPTAKAEVVEEDAELLAPTFKDSFSDALTKAFDQLGVEDVAAEKLVDEKDGGGGCLADVDAGGKKKKKKPKLLFSTSMQSRMK